MQDLGNFMSTTRLRLTVCACLLAWCCGLTLGLAGCGSGNPNEAEFPAPPGKPPDDPNETVSQRRSRTLRSPEKTKAEKAAQSKSGAGTAKTR